MTNAGAVRIGTRQSRLAVAQADIAVRLLPPRIGSTEMVTIATQGDAISERQPHGGWVVADGQFTGELERALLERRVDLVVHSFKDLPTAPAAGLLVAAILERGDARDCLITATGGGPDSVPHGGRVGTSSPRRAAQLSAIRPDLVIITLRGNVETRLKRLRDGEFDGLLLAAAGLDRLGMPIPSGARLPFELMLPAPAQGALALQVRAGDAALLEALATLDHRPTRIAVEAERTLLREIGGGCLAPLGALGEVSGERLRLRAAFETSAGILRAEAEGSAADPAWVVHEVARDLGVAVSA